VNEGASSSGDPRTPSDGSQIPKWALIILGIFAVLLVVGALQLLGIFDGHGPARHGLGAVTEWPSAPAWFSRWP
jgi:hypothetical protein